MLPAVRSFFCRNLGLPQAYQWMWREFLELEPELKVMLSERERGGAAFKVR